MPDSRMLVFESLVGRDLELLAGVGAFGIAATASVTGDATPRDLAANFTPARRFLNYLADRYLYRLETSLMNPVAS